MALSWALKLNKSSCYDNALAWIPTDSNTPNANMKAAMFRVPG